jgi:hypothetical protein
MAKNVLTENLAEPLNGARTAKVHIDAGDGNLKIDRLAGGEQLLASGTLEYVEKQGRPTRTLVSSGDEATFTLRGGSGKQPWIRLPWAACNAATEWQIHLNPGVSADITAHSDGGNVRLDMRGMTVTHVFADTGGGNMDVVLPDTAADLGVTAKTGAGNVTVEIGSDSTGCNSIDAGSGAGNVVVAIPSRLAARIRATTGLGQAMVDSRFAKIADNTYQSPDFEGAAHKVEITAKSGAGNVIVKSA